MRLKRKAHVREEWARDWPAGFLKAGDEVSVTEQDGDLVSLIVWREGQPMLGTDDLSAAELAAVLERWGKPDETDPASYVETAKEGTLAHFLSLECASNNPAEQDQAEIEGLDLGAEYDDHELQNESDVIDAATEAIDSWPLAVERTVTFELVLGTGGPDTRLLYECDVYKDGGFEDSSPEYAIRRVIFRYSWSGSAEIVLGGEDQEIAEAFGRRCVPELAE